MDCYYDVTIFVDFITTKGMLKAKRKIEMFEIKKNRASATCLNKTSKN